MILALAVLLTLYSSNCSEVSEEYNLPLFLNDKHYDEELYEINLGRDSYSGCACKHSSRKWIICFGQENCVRLPKEIKVKEKSLKIRTSNIQKIQKGELKNYGYLTHLEIEANIHLEELEEGCFQELTNLRNLSISYNPSLHTLQEKTFVGLKNLQELVLTKNGLNNIHILARALSPNYLPKLITLILNQNQFFHVREDDLLPLQGSPVKELSLVLCEIDYLHPKSLTMLKNLTILRLGENTFNSTVLTDLLNVTIIKHKIPLCKLYLCGAGFRKKPPKELLQVIALSNITSLNLALNQFVLLNNESFIPMPNIKKLDLSKSLTSDIDSDTFVGLPNLQTLLLNKNELSYLPDGILLPQLTYLDLSSNSENQKNPSYFSLGIYKFMNMTNLKILNLSYNNLRVILVNTFVGLNSLEILGLRNASLFQFKNGSFLPLKKLIYLDLENNPITGNAPLDKDIFIGLDKLEVLLLGGCALTTFNPAKNPFRNLKSLRYLGLERNNIARLSPLLFLPLAKLTDISLSQNFLSSWQHRLFTNNSIEHLQAFQNKFTSFTTAMLEDFANMKDLDISSNPFSCDCNLVYSLLDNTFTKNNRTLLDLIKEDSPYCTAPSHYSNMSVVAYFDRALDLDMCELSIAKIVIKYSLLLISMVSLIVVLFVVSYKYRWHIRYWVFLTKIAIIRKGKVLQRSRVTPDKSYHYDAFVSYSNEDRNFVVNMINMLENYEPYLKLCVYERDFRIGEIISESVLENVAKSRKTLLVVSNAYIKSQWCRWEAHVAENYRLFFQNENGDLVNDSIVVIKLGSVDKAHMTPMLKYLLKTRVYLEWEPERSKQKEFWKKLRMYLTPPCRKEEFESCLET